MKKCLYHGSCNDGFAAALCFWKKWQGEGEFIPVYYGKPIPILSPDDEVVIVDFSYPRAQLEDLKGRVKSLLVLDHHKTAEADCVSLSYAIFDGSKSGARLAWEYCFPTEEAPKLIRIVEDRDLWKFEYPDTNPAYEGLRLIGLDFKVWAEAMRSHGFLSSIIKDGRAIVTYNEQLTKQMARQARILIIGGHQVPVVNATNCISELGHYLCENNKDYPFSASYMDSKDYRKWSLRSVGDIDVSLIAKRYGGGGHKNAAGFETDFTFMGDK